MEARSSFTCTESSMQIQPIPLCCPRHAGGYKTRPNHNLKTSPHPRWFVFLFFSKTKMDKLEIFSLLNIVEKLFVFV